MYITHKNIQELRAVVDQPEEVLRWCIRMEFQHRVTDRVKTIEKLQRDDKRSLEEAERLVAYWDVGGPMLMELFKCPDCRGWGWNSHSDDCIKCHGTGKTHRFQMPPDDWRPGDPVG